MNNVLEKEGECQLQGLYVGAEPLNILDRFRLISLRLLTAVEKRLGRQAGMGSAARSEGAEVLRRSGERPGSKTARDSACLAEGDIVEVRSWDEIRTTLDDSLRCKGLEFMPEMKKFCGTRLRVRKKVRAIFDERAWRMLKIKNTYLLEDCVCDGKGMSDKEGCDRCCYFFWKDAWLRKVWCLISLLTIMTQATLQA